MDTMDTSLLTCQSKPLDPMSLPILPIFIPQHKPYTWQSGRFISE